MCKECVHAVKKYFPFADDENEVGDILMSYTAFPFGGPEIVEPQVKNLRYWIIIGACNLCGRLPGFAHERYCFNSPYDMFEERNPFVMAEKYGPPQT